MVDCSLFGMINIIYGALCAMAQKDFKKLIAYSSVSHMGFVMLGMASLNTIGISGAVFQMFNHGTITAMLFIIVGVIYDRAHTREIDAFRRISHTDADLHRIYYFSFLCGNWVTGIKWICF